MPTVPIIPTVGQDPVRGAQFQAGQVAPVVAQQPQLFQQAGQAMERSGEQWQQLEAMRKRRSDIAAHTEREAAIAEKDTVDLVAYLKRQGKEAEQSFDGWVKDLDKRYKSALDSAPEGPQREWLRERLATQRQRLFNSAIKHREEQSAVWRVASAETAATTSADQAAALWGSPEADVYVDEARQKADELAALRGLDGDARAKFVAERISGVRVGAIENMLAEKRAGQAAAYLAQHGGEIDKEQFAATNKKVRLSLLDEGTRRLTQEVPSFADRLAAVDAMEWLDDSEKDTAKRMLLQRANEVDAQNAQIAQDVEQRAMTIRAANPSLRLEDVDPALARDVQRFGIKLQRVTDEKFMADFEQATPEQFRKWRSMTDAQLHREFAPFTDAHDEGYVMKVIRGDYSGATIDQNIKLLAKQIGLLPAIPSGQAAMREEESQKFLNWRLNTIGPMLQSLADELKRPLTPRDVQERIVNPIMEDKVWSDVGVNERLPLMELQLRNEAPIDDPLTEEDESRDFSKYQNLYVEVEGQRVMLRDIPLTERENIRQAWRIKHPGQWLSVEQEAREWIKVGRPGAPKPASVGVPVGGAPSEPKMPDPLRFGGR